MPDDNKVRVSAEFDVSPIVAGTTQAANAFDNLGGKVAANAELAQLALERLTDKAANLGVRMMADGKSTEEISAALQKLGLSAEESATLMQLLTDEAVKQAIALRNTGNAAEEAGAKQVNAFVMARVEAAALSGSTTGIERGLLQVAARSETLGPIMQKAFSAFLIVAFIELLEQAVDAIGNFTESIAGFGKEVQKEYLEAIAFNERLIQVNLEARDKVAAISAIGKEGAAKYAIEAKNAEESTQRWATRLGELNKELPAAQAELDHLTKAASRWNDPLAGLTDVDFKLAGQKQRVQELTKEWESLNIKMKELPIEAQARAAEEFARRQQDAIANTKAQIDAERTVGLARIANVEAIDRQLFELTKAEADKNSDALKAAIVRQTQDLVDAEDQRFKLMRDELVKERELQDREGRTGKNVTPEITKINAQLEALAIEHQTKLSAITAQGEEQRREIERREQEEAEKFQEEEEKRTEDAAKKELETIERVMAEKVRLQAQAGRNQLEQMEKAAAEQRKLDTSGIFGETGKQQIDDAREALQREQAEINKTIGLYKTLELQLIALGEARDSPKVLQAMQGEERAIQQLQLAWQKYQAVVDQVAQHQEQVFKQAFDRVTNTLNQGLINVLDRTQTWGQAMAKVWDSLAASVIKNILTIIEQEAVSLLVHQELVETEKLDDAKTAASGAYRSVMDSAIPFPLNFALAAAAGATAFAAVMAFERGGLVPGNRAESVPAVLHGGEMVLPSSISQPLVGAIPAIQNFNRSNEGSASGGAGPTYKTMHNHIRVNISSQGGQVDHDAIIESVRRGIRTGALSI